MKKFQKINVEEKVKGMREYIESFGQKWFDKVIIQQQANSYIEENFILDNVDAKYGNCLVKSTSFFSKKDGSAIDQDDLDAFNALDNGQENKVTGNVGDFQVKYYYLCDSSD